MLKYQSQVIKAGSVVFPEFKSERVYMTPFFKDQGLPLHLKRWQSTVDQMLVGVETDQQIYLMIDQAFVPSGKTHRRPGLHVDGYWIPLLASHGGSGGSHSSQGDKDKGSHGSSPGSHHGTPSKGGHGSKPGTHTSKSSLSLGKHGGDHKAKAGSWETAIFDTPETIILASNISAARAYVGEYVGPIKDMGQCEHLSVTGLEEIIMEANQVYLGNVNFLHESLPVTEDCFRTVIRLNVPGFEF